MLDKNELQDLLVKLKLGTVSLDDAIEEIEKGFYPDLREGGLNLWRKMGAEFDAAADCRDKNLNQIARMASGYIEKRQDFVFFGLDEEKLSSLSKAFHQCEFVYDAGIMTSLRKKPVFKGKKAAVVSSFSYDDPAVRETEESLKFMGVEPAVFPEASFAGPGNVFSLKNNLEGAGAVIVIEEAEGLLSAVSSFVTVPVIALFQGKGEPWKSSSFTGVLFCVSCGFGAAAAVLRTFRSRPLL